MLFSSLQAMISGLVLRFDTESQAFASSLLFFVEMIINLHMFLY